MRIAIVGGAGFVGCAVARAMLATGLHPVIMDTPGRLSVITGLEPAVPRAPFDFSTDRIMTAQLEGFDALVHLGCTTNPARSMASMVFDAESNIGPSLRLFEAAAEANVSRVVFSSSGGTVYGVPATLPVTETAPTHPRSAYGVSKLAIEKYLSLFTRLNGVSLRLANPYGAFQLRGAAVGVIARYVLAVRHRQPLEVWGDGSNVRDYIAIEDVAAAFVAAVSTPTLETGAYNVGSGSGVDLTTIIKTIFAVTGCEVPVVHVPARPYDVPAIVLDSSLFAQRVGWRPRISLAAGVGQLWSEVLAHAR